MNEHAAALQIQNWYRGICIRKLLVRNIRKEFEQICLEIGDKSPQWPKNGFCYPDFEMPDDVESNFIQGNISNRIGILKYQESLSPK